MYGGLPPKEANQIENAVIVEVMCSEDVREGPRRVAEYHAPLFYGDGLGQVAGLVYVATAADGDVVSEELERQHGKQRK